MAAEMAIGLQVSDHGFDRRAAAQLTLDEAKDAALLAGDEDTAPIGDVVAAIALVTWARSITQSVSFSVASLTPPSVCPS
jgi:hypothetical protein